MKPNYYAIIPAEVRYAAIMPHAKLLYGEITALCNQKGYCWASNSYFSELYGVTKNTISTWVSELKKNNFISVEVIRNNKRQVIKRKLAIIEIRDRGVIENHKENTKTLNNITESVLNRMKIFANQVIIENILDKSDGNDFVSYWTETNKSGTKMRFEMEKTWDIRRRLQRWSKNNSKWQNGGKGSKTTTYSTKLQNAQEEWLKAKEMLNKL